MDAPVIRDIPSPQYTGSTFRLEVHVVDSLTCEATDTCQHCQINPLECNAWVTFADAEEVGMDQIVLETCSACLIKVIDGTSYLDDTQTITVEVTRRATYRPF